MKNVIRPPSGFSLVELMIAMVIGLFLVGAATSVFIAQSAMSKTTISQAQIQNAANALAALVTPIIRGAGFTGCSNLGEVIGSLNTGGPAPLSDVAAANGPVAMIKGYEAMGTEVGQTLTIPATNAANSSNLSDWSLSLEPTLQGLPQSGSDVLLVLGAIPGFNPVAVTTPSTKSSTALGVQNTTELAQLKYPYAAVTDCAKTTIFQVTSVSATSVLHAAGSSPLTNKSDYLPVPFAPASQLVGLQLSALYVAQGPGDQSNLMRATYQGGQAGQGGGWTAVPLVPGVDNLQILYGIGDGTSITNYFPASNVTDWTKVDAIRLGFLIEGDKGSGATTAATSHTLLGTKIIAPADGRLRHVVEMTVNLRNAS